MGLEYENILLKYKEIYYYFIFTLPDLGFI
jgi:hypothetical protein